MISNVHNGEVVCIQELQSATGESQISQHDELSRRRPEQMVVRLLLKLLQQTWSLAGVDSVEADADIGHVSVDDRELGTDRLPSERVNRLFDFNGIDGDLLLSHVEDFEVVIHAGVFDFGFVFADLGVAIDLHTEVVAALLPVDLAVGYVEEILGADLLTAGDLKERHAGRHVLVFRHPVGQDVVDRRPAEVSDALHLDGLLV